MPFVNKNLKSFARGDTWTTKFVFTDSSKNPIDITNYTYWLTLKTNKTDGDPGVAQTSAVAGSPDSNLGIVYITMTPAQTGSLVPGTNYHYDLQQVDNQSPAVISTLLIGRVKVVQDITLTT